MDWNCMNWELFWTAFGAIGGTLGAIATTAAVIVALWQTKYANKKQLKVEFSDNIVVVPSQGDLSQNASGKGMITTEGFALFAGAVLNEKTSEKSLSKGAATLRKKHLASNKVKDFVTTEDILFSSSSAAADFVTGYSVSGPATWKNAAGVTLKELEAKATK